jgi:hypothetical protein
MKISGLTRTWNKVLSVVFTPGDQLWYTNIARLAAWRHMLSILPRLAANLSTHLGGVGGGRVGCFAYGKNALCYKANTSSQLLSSTSRRVRTLLYKSFKKEI